MWSPAQLAALIACVLACVMVGIWLGRRGSRRRVRARMARSRDLGARGEAIGLRLLRRQGYTVIAEQPTAHVELRVDGELERFLVRADALVSRRGQRFVVEFKGGRDVARVAHRSTRRQLLEYAFAFPADGVLLVDAVHRRIARVEFPQALARSQVRRHALR